MPYHLQKILITGSRGFIGSALEKFLGQSTAFELIGVDVDTCPLDQREPIEKLIRTKRPDYIFHLAGGRMADAKELEQSNLVTTRHLFDAVLQNPNYTPRIVLPGSAAEYGPMPAGKESVTEHDLPQPVSAYGKVKYKQAQMSFEYALKGIHVSIARIFNIIGPEIPQALVAGRFARQIVDIEEGAEPVVHTWNLSGKRDFVDIVDVLAALFEIATKGKSGEVYNVCSGNAVKVRVLLEQMFHLSKVPDIEIKEDVSKGQDSHDCIGSYQKLNQLLGWQPNYSFTKSVERLLQSYRHANTHRT